MKVKYLVSRGYAVWLIALSFLFLGATAYAAPGDLVGSVSFSVNCTSGVGIGIAYDGENLWYSCTSQANDLYRADPLTGNVTAAYDIAGGLGALAYDSSRNAIWAGWDDGSGNVRLIQLDGAKNVVGSSLVFNATEAVYFVFDDGLAYDASDDTLYVSGDIAPDIHQYMTDGTHIRNFTKSSDSNCGNSGLAIGGDLLYEGFDGCSMVVVVNKSDTGTTVFNFSTLVAGDPNFRDEDLECDTNTFAAIGKHVMWSVEAYSPRRAHAFEIPFGSCGVGGGPAENGVISGVKFNDLDGDGVKNAGEPGLEGWKIVLTNENGEVLTVLTGVDGSYLFKDLEAGTYTVEEVLKDGWTQTLPVSGAYIVNLSAGENVVDVDFGNIRLPPKAACVETVNPAGKNIPPAGKTTLPGPKGGQNEDGFYELLAKDVLDPDPLIFVRDSVSGAIFGPFASGDKIKYTEANGAAPSSKPMGGPNSAIASHITGAGDAMVYAVNAAGVGSKPVSCLVPPLPK